MLKSLVLRGFRSHGRLVYEPVEGLNLIVGSNGSGKTNILEAIYVLSALRSFRPGRLRDLISWGGEAAYIEAKTERARLEMGFGGRDGARVLKKDGRVSGVLEFLEELPAVIFTPQDLNLLVGEPAGRRRFLNVLSARLDGGFLRVLRDYRAVLRRRNVLLQRGAGAAEMRFWDEKFARLARLIWEERRRVGAGLERGIKDLGGRVELAREVEFRMSQPEYGETEEKIRARLEEGLGMEMRMGRTLMGPHLDDWSLSYRGRSLRLYGSRGEQRSAILVMFFVKTVMLAGRREVKPVLMLDDVFSELDEERKRMLGGFLSEYQTIMTGVERPEGLEVGGELVL